MSREFARIALRFVVFAITILPRYLAVFSSVSFIANRHRQT